MMAQREIMTVNHSNVIIPTLTQDGCTALHYAAAGGHAAMSLDLVNNGADMDARCSSVRTTCFCAVSMLLETQKTATHIKCTRDKLIIARVWCMCMCVVASIASL